MESSSNKRAWFLLAIAAAFCITVLVVKRQQIFGSAPQPKQTEGSTEKTNGAAGQAKPAKTVDPNAPRIEVRVLDDSTGKPIAGARVVTMTRQATALSDDTTGADGRVLARPSGGALHGAVAFHEAYRVGAKLGKASGLELRLRPAGRIVVHRETENAAQREWQEFCAQTVKILYAPKFNPIRGDEAYLAHRMLTHLDLLGHEWPLTGEDTEVPRYLEVPAKVVMYSRPKTEKRLDSSGVRNPRPTAPAAIVEMQETHAEIAKDARFVGLKAQETPHLAVLRYEREAEDKRTVMLVLSCVSRDPKDEKMGMRTTVVHDKTAFEETDGTATFRVWNLHANFYDPTLIFLEPGKPTRTKRCNPVWVDGRSEARLTPYAAGTLTVRLTGAREEATDQSDVKLEVVHLLETHMISASEFPTIDRGKREFRFENLTPVTYRVLARAPNRVSALGTARVVPGKHVEVELEMRSVCRLALLFPRTSDATSLKIRGLDPKTEREVERHLWDQVFVLKADGEVARLTSRQHSLDLPYGTYELILTGPTPKTQRVVLDSPRREVRLGLDD